MSLFDQIAGEIGGQLFGSSSGSTEQGPVSVDSVVGLIQQSGGLDGVVEAFRSNGLESILSSWLSPGENAPVSHDQVHQVFGSELLGRFAQELGLDPATAVSHLIPVLPQALTRLVLDSGLSSSGLLGIATGFLRSRLLG